MIKITADSTCDLSPEIIEKMDITLTPLYILVDDKTFQDGVDIRPTDVFRYMEKEGKTCRTAAVNVFDYAKVFEELAPKYDAVIQICIGSEFSSCYQNASIAAQDFKNVYVINSQNLSTGSGYLVYEAALMAREGIEPEEICRRLEEIIPTVDTSFVIDQLDYLYKGGRCSGLEAVGAKILQIKPCIEVVDGKMVVGKKYRGGFESCLEKYVKERLLSIKDIDYSRVFVTYSTCPEETVNRVKEAVGRYGEFKEVIETRAGCTVSSHCGPNTLGIIFKRKAKKEGALK